jgi:hypothetical protein
MTKRATGESHPQSGLIIAAAMIKMMALITTKRSALEAAISPAGISRSAVLGFLASKFLSRYRLNAIAALRAESDDGEGKGKYGMRESNQLEIAPDGIRK